MHGQCTHLYCLLLKIGAKQNSNLVPSHGGGNAQPIHQEVIVGHLLVITGILYWLLDCQVQGILEGETQCGASRDGEAIKTILGIQDQNHAWILTTVAAILE